MPREHVTKSPFVLTDAIVTLTPARTRISMLVTAESNQIDSSNDPRAHLQSPRCHL